MTLLMKQTSFVKIMSHYYTLCTFCIKQFEIFDVTTYINCPHCASPLSIGEDAQKLAIEMKTACPTANVFADYRRRGGFDESFWYWQVRDTAKRRCEMQYVTVCSTCNNETYLPFIHGFSPYHYHTGRMSYCESCYSAIYYDPDFEDIWAEYEETFLPYIDTGVDPMTDHFVNKFFVKTL